MRNPIQKMAAGTVILAALGLISVRPGWAQARPGSSEVRAAFGGVDLQRVFNEYKQQKTSSEQIQVFGQSLERVLQRLIEKSGSFLPDAEMRELARLYEKPNLADGEKQRVGVLETKGVSAADELRGLQNVSAPSDQQRSKLTELTNSRQKGSQTLEALQQEYRGQLDTKQRQLTQQITESMRAAVAKVAQDKNLSVVFDAAVAVYTSNDITNDVIKQLNR